MIRNAPLKNYYNEVLRLVPDGSASGSVASFDDGGKDCPIKSLKVGIEPIQSGSGTPSPSNVRAISPRSSVEVYISPTTTASDGKTYTINLGQSIYGGTLDAVKGELVIDKALVDLSSISASASKDSNLWRIESSSPMYPIDNAYKVGFCDKLVFKTSYEAVNENDGSIAFARSNGTLIILRNDAITTAADAVDFAKALQVVYPIASPTTVSLSPIEIRTLYGINNLWSDSGNVDVEYKANATLLYNKIRNAILAQGGNV